MVLSTFDLPSLLHKNIQDFSDGSIKKIMLHNFLTSEDVEIVPGPYMNVLVGGNGAGKSTVICGIALALGGSPKILGRSERLRDYVKRECEDGFVEVHLHDSKRPDDLKIRITVTSSGIASYKIDGRSVTSAEVRRTTAKYGIQVDNPCTFLAQDKVKSFAEQNAQQLLENTERAGPKGLVDLHNNVKELKEEGAGQSTNCRSLETRLAAVNSELTTLAPRVENYRRNENMRSMIKLLEKKLAVVECEEALKELENGKEQFCLKKEELRKLNRKATPLKDRISAENESIKTSRERIGDYMSAVREERFEFELLANKESFGSLMREAKLKFEKTRKEYDGWEEERAKAKNELAILEQKMEAAKKETVEDEKEAAKLREEYHRCAKEDAALKDEFTRINDVLIKINQERTAFENEAKLEQRFFEDRFAVFEGNGLSRRLRCAEAWRWYEAHKEEFRFPVYVPILSMALSRTDDAKYLENVIAYRDLVMFIFGCKEDERLLCSSRHPWRINSTIVTEEQVMKYDVPGTVPNNLRNFGFECMLSELFTAPPRVKAFLNNVCKLDRIPLGNMHTEDALDEVCEALKTSFRLFFTPVSRVSISISRYDNSSSIRIDEVRTQLSLLTAHVPRQGTLQDPAAMRSKMREWGESEKKVNEELLVIKNKQLEVQRLQEDYRKRLNIIKRKKDALTDLKNQVLRKEMSIKSKEKDKPNIENAAKALEESRKVFLRSSLRNVGNSLECLEKVMNKHLLATAEQKKISLTKARLNELNIQIARFQDSIGRAEVECAECEKVLKHLSRKAEKSIEKLKAEVSISSVVEEELSDEEKRIFKKLKKEFAKNSLPDTIEAIEQSILEEKGRLEATRSDGERKDLDRHNELIEAQDVITKRLAKIKDSIENWTAQMDAALTAWLEILEALVERISNNFHKFFARIGCAGEVRLDKPEDKYDIDQYGIHIMVQFRAGERLRRLTHQVQSGGERSVATMLYLMALQELSPVPFRCVDEINQGMDPNNERRVFNMMVDLLSDAGNLSKTQYFLLTPKLLPDLKYNQNVELHCVQKWQSI